jgi:putative hemolysin
MSRLAAADGPVNQRAEACTGTAAADVPTKAFGTHGPWRDPTSRLTVAMARSDADVRAAQRLRHRVFIEELGVNLDGGAAGLEFDRYDEHCEHMLVRVGRDGPVVGTYRLLGAAAARRCGGFMAEELFDLASLRPVRHELLELGRACVDPGFRGGTVVMLLWNGIVRYAIEGGYRYLFGSASLDLGAGRAEVLQVCERVLRMHRAPSQFAVLPRVPLAGADGNGGAEGAAAPAVLEGYLRAGAWACGEPSWDRRFNSADLLVLLPVTRFTPRYARRFLHRAPEERGQEQAQPPSL